MTIDDIIKDGPFFPGKEACEPSLRTIIFTYYTWLDDVSNMKKAVDLTDLYIDSIIDKPRHSYLIRGAYEENIRRKCGRLSDQDGSWSVEKKDG